MKKIVITGAKGFFGSRFIEVYKNRYDIISLNHNDLDIKEYEKTVEKIKSIKPDYLIHAAAIADTTFCEENPEESYAVNVTGTINLAKACAMMGVKMIYLSSDQIYNGNKDAGPYDETTPPIPNNMYGKQKYEAEEEIQRIINSSVILRLTWLCGLPEKTKLFKSNIIWKVVEAAFTNEPLKLRANEYRGITYVYDIIDNFDKILNLPGGVYNTGCENNLSTYEIGKHILKEIGLEHRIDELLIKDTESYKTQNRDLRIYNKKLSGYGVSFNESKESISKCLNDFTFRIL